MSIYKRPGSPNFYCRFEISGEEIRKSTWTDDREKASEFENHLRDRLWHSHKLGLPKRYFFEAGDRWLQERDDKRSAHSDKTMLKWFHSYISNDTLLTDITGDIIAELRATKCKEASRATVNRHMALLRSILKAAKDQWEWIDTHPKVPMYREILPEPRWITPAEFKRLHKALPPYLARCAAFAVATGLRSGPIRALQWNQVDMRKKVLMIKVSQAKNAKALRVPLGQKAMEVLRECRKTGKEGYVFTKDGAPVPREMVNRAWQRACKKAKLPDLRFHDLRHTWASWHVQKGTPLHVLQLLGGWASIELVQRYAHLAPTDLDRWARSIG